MTKSDAAVVSTPDLTPFLYAAAAVERSDMELTVLSALARQGLDPWREAERLANLPRSTAANELARTFSAARLPNSASLAERLVGLLPRVGQTAARRPVAGRDVRPFSMKWMVAAMAAGVLSSFIFAGAPKQADTIAPASWFTENVPASKPVNSAVGPTHMGTDKPAAAPSQGPGEPATGAVAPPA